VAKDRGELLRLAAATLSSRDERKALSLIRPIGDPGVPWPGLLLGIPLLGFYYWCTNQSIVQRMLSAKNIDHARWGALFAALTDAGYNGAVSIEVEDRAYEGSLEDRKRALRQSKRYLEQFCG
jgi:sugar phosphate isomerase/epimerase